MIRRNPVCIQRQFALTPSNDATDSHFGTVADGSRTSVGTTNLRSRSSGSSRPPAPGPLTHYSLMAELGP
jgi:hypothetical protein